MIVGMQAIWRRRPDRGGPHLAHEATEGDKRVARSKWAVTTNPKPLWRTFWVTEGIAPKGWGASRRQPARNRSPIDPPHPRHQPLPIVTAVATSRPCPETGSARRSASDGSCSVGVKTTGTIL